MALITLLSKEENPVYLLNEDIYYATEHKIMQNVPGLLKCYKANLNGKSELIYTTDNLISLSRSLPQMDTKTFLAVAIGICETIKAILSNSFLNLSHLDIERTFVRNQSPYLTYLPITDTPNGCTEEDIISYLIDCAKKTESPDDLLELSKKRSIDEFSKQLKVLEKKEPRKTMAKTLTLYNASEEHKIVINKPRFLIGRKESAVDGVIPYNEFVGRVHCQIEFKNDNFYVLDLDSSNGTCVNSTPITKETVLKNGDLLEIADVKFKVLIK